MPLPEAFLPHTPHASCRLPFSMSLSALRVRYDHCICKKRLLEANQSFLKHVKFIFAEDKGYFKRYNEEYFKEEKMGVGYLFSCTTDSGSLETQAQHLTLLDSEKFRKKESNH